MRRITESDLVLPTLYLLSKKEIITTSELIISLRNLLHPAGEDTALLSGRNDDRFSQKVRNLKSHNTLTSRELVNVRTVNGQTGYTITKKGKELYSNNKENLETLFTFTISQTQEILSNMVSTPIVVLTESPLILEGTIVGEKMQTIRKRSMKLRDAAIEHYTENGHIECHACCFDFNKAYDLKRNYIEMHHIQPIAEGERALSLDKAIQYIIPLCANCHRVVHLSTPMLSMQKLKKHIHFHININQ